MHTNQSMKTVFFYGLFMDVDLLKRKGLHPVASKVVSVSGYGLRIGDRATLEQSENECTFGTVMQLSTKELAVLYREESVADYLPQVVIATDMDGQSIEAISYVLAMEKVSGSNRDYAQSLAVVAKKIKLPHDYTKEIETWT